MPRNRRLIIKIRFILPIYSVAERLINLSIVIYTNLCAEYMKSSYMKRVIYFSILYNERYIEAVIYIDLPVLGFFLVSMDKLNVQDIFLYFFCPFALQYIFFCHFHGQSISHKNFHH